MYKCSYALTTRSLLPAYRRIHFSYTRSLNQMLAYTLTRANANIINAIALSTQLVRFLLGTLLSEVVFASKSSFYPAIH